MTQKSDFESVVHTLVEHFESTFARGNVSEIAQWYTEHAMLMPAEFDFIQGRQEIERFWQSAIDIGIKRIKLDLIEVEQHGDTAIEISSYTMRNVNDQLIDRGKGMVVWKWENGTWKLHRDIWTSSMGPQ